ncbi:kinase-like domain-containing protein [Thelephora terrestris]|uniref:Kinase-like domain-containing protein n=1 Tax=Thelephora terrestris TaxID=56493 RepID=A0A9P6H4S3_9AGAM|nr:kinase-like domain-containing protein [Thelephora terrestris]
MSVQGACQDPQPLMLSQTTTTLEMRKRAAQPLNLTDALNYLDLVKLRFRETRRPELYDRFLEIILDFSKGFLDPSEMIMRLLMLFREESELIERLNVFLPDGYHIETSCITITTPMGVLAQMPDGSIAKVLQTPTSLTACTIPKLIGFRSEGMRIGRQVGRPAEIAAAQWHTPVDGHTQENQERTSPNNEPQPVSQLAVLAPGLNAPALGRLISRTFPPHEVISVINEIFTSVDEVKMLRNLCGDIAQTFINVVHEALDLQDLPQRLRGKCLAVLYWICGRQALLPRALQIPICYNRFDAPLYRGGFADVWKGQFQGSDVAVKVLRLYATTDFAKVASRFCKEVVAWNSLRHPNVMSLLGATMDGDGFAMVSEWMTNGNIKEFVKAHWEVNRFELLEGVARGLAYIHSQGMIHGDLKGANILIDQDGRARLADFGLLTFLSDPTYFTASSSVVKGGTMRWMSPELLYPEKFGLDHSCPAKESDCYALGMVIYEVISGQVPFALFKEYIAMRKISDGEHPARPEGAEGVWFTDDLWRMLGLCWATQAQSRPSIEDVLECLERASSAWVPLPPQVHEGLEDCDSVWDLSVLVSPVEEIRADPFPSSTRKLGSLSSDEEADEVKG